MRNADHDLVDIKRDVAAIIWMLGGMLGLQLVMLALLLSPVLWD